LTPPPALIEEFVRPRVPLIAVILDGAPALSRLSLFLSGMTWGGLPQRRGEDVRAAPRH
jgi:hypothetical protein